MVFGLCAVVFDTNKLVFLHIVVVQNRSVLFSRVKNSPVCL